MTAWDESAFRWLNDLAGRSETFDRLVTFLIGDYLVPFLATLAVAWLWFAGRGRAESGRWQQAALQSLAALGICQLLVALTNIGVGRLRPFEQISDVTVLFYEPINSSFPAHPVATVVALGLAIWPARRWLGGLVLVLGSLLGLGRMIAGLWFPSDVVAGVVIGALAALLAAMALRRLSGAVNFIRRTTASMGLE